MQPTDWPGPHEYHVQHCRPGRRVAWCARGIPPLQAEHDQDREPPEQAQSLGIFLLCRLRRAFRRPASERSYSRIGKGMQLRENSGLLPQYGITVPKPALNHLAQARKVFDIELAGVKVVRSQLDAHFNTAVELVTEVLRNRGKIIVVGIGKSGNIGRKIAATLTSTG